MCPTRWTRSLQRRVQIRAKGLVEHHHGREKQGYFELTTNYSTTILEDDLDGACLVVDLDNFVHRSLREFVEPEVLARLEPHATKQIKLEVDGFRFSLVKEYERLQQDFGRPQGILQ